MDREKVWIGEGSFKFSHLEKPWIFFTKWSLFRSEKERLFWRQEIQIAGHDRQTFANEYLVTFKGHKFEIQCLKGAFEELLGRGIATQKTMAWEFFDELRELHGFECYQQIEEGQYRFQAEFLAGEDKTEIEGLLWPKELAHVEG